jgi:putative ABC transport system ATP-binding protein
MSLAARDLYRFFHAGDDEVQALRGVSLEVNAGEVVAVVGPSGSGKSTLLSCLTGLDEPDGGVVHVSGERMSRRPEPERAALRAKHIGVLFQSGNLLPHLTVAANVAVARRLAGLPPAGSGDVLDRLGVGALRDAVPATLSGGEAVRAGLAVALANDPAVLVADEPTAEVDGVAEARVVELLREIAAGGTAVLVATHSATLAASADRVHVLTDGVLA